MNINININININTYKILELCKKSETCSGSNSSSVNGPGLVKKGSSETSLYQS